MKDGLTPMHTCYVNLKFENCIKWWWRNPLLCMGVRE